MDNVDRKADGSSPASQSRATVATTAKELKPGFQQPFAREDAHKLLSRAKLEALLEEVAPGERLDDDVVALLQEHIEDFVESALDYACRLAKHRKSRTIEARDVQLYLQKAWCQRVPGYGVEERIRRRSEVPAHVKRMAEARKQRNIYASSR
jgi:transcription initiation factor TFIID subunit 12